MRPIIKILIAAAVFCPVNASSGVAASSKELVIATTGGLMGEALRKFFYEPFGIEYGADVVPFDIEIPDQWARTEAMNRTGKIEFDVVASSPADFISRNKFLAKIDCTKLPSVKEYGVDGACTDYGVARTIGGMLIAFNRDVFKDKQPRTWADFWDVKKFPGPRGLPDTGDRDWWVPAVALLADGVPPNELFPLDLDRAYRKLDEIRPSVAVWWKSGDQVQQIMRTGEVVMTMSYSGRALQVIKEGNPIEMSWSGALQDVGYMSVLKGAPHPEAAMAYLDFFYKNYKKHPEFMRAVNYATFSRKAIELLPKEEQANYATSESNFGGLVKPDYRWIGDNRTMLKDRWLAWLNN